MSSYAPTPVAITSLAFAFAIAPAFAQSPIDSAAAVFVTATRAAQDSGDVLADYTLIDAEEIARSSHQSVIDLLQRQRGIEVVRNGGAGSAATVSIRGANANQSIVLVDGVRIGSSTQGTANWSALPLASIDHIEIIYGPLSTMYGADALGGVVQIFTRRGAGPARVAAFVGAGADATRTVESSVSGGAGSLNYAIAAAYTEAEGFSSTTPKSSSYNADDDGYAKQSASARLAYTLAPGHEVGASALHSRLDGQYDAGASSYDARVMQRLDNLALFANNRIAPTWNSHVQLTRAADKSGTDSSAAASGKSQINTVQQGLSWQNDLSFGVDMLQLLLERRVEKVLSSSTPALTGERATNSVAASYQLKRGAHLATISARNDKSTVYGEQATGALAYGYRISRSLRASASAGTSFRAPTFNELYFPNFGVATNKPEHGRNAELALAFDNGVAQLGATVYRNRVSDLLVTATPCPFSPKTYTSGCAYNVDRALLEGVSLNGRTQWSAFSLSTSLDWQDPRDDTTGKALNRRAKRHATVKLDYVTGPLTLGADMQASSARFDDAANRNTLGGYTLFNLYGAWRFAPDWSAQLRVDNVGDKRYELARNYATAGARVFAGLRYAMP
ncbi:MAG: TonB-dependent receptor [Massilia sp.]